MTHNFPGNFQIAKKSDFELHNLIFFQTWDHLKSDYSKVKL